MILKLKKSVRKQAKCVHKETEKLYKKLSDKGDSAKFDTNEVLLRLDRITDELKALREVINTEKERAYLEKLGGIPLRKSKLPPR